MDDDQIWFGSLAVAAITLNAHVIDLLTEKGVLTHSEVRELFDRALLNLEGRDQAIPEQYRKLNALARFHLDRVLQGGTLSTPPDAPPG